MATSASTLILQSRDLAVLSALAENGLLDTDLIHTRHFGEVSRRRCLQRLALYQTQALTRIVPLSLWCGGSHRSVPTVHMLTERGLEVVRDALGEAAIRVSKGDPKPETIQHRLQIVRTKLVFDDACRNHTLTPPHWFLEQDRNPDASPQLPPSQRRILYHPFRSPPQVCTCQPDAACRFFVPRDVTLPAAGVTDLIGFFEIDCSTEGRKQVANKLPGYGRLLAEKPYRRYFPGSESAVVRVFWVCRTWDRVESLCERVKSDPVAAYFRFSVAGDLSPETALTSPVWYAIDGKRREILRLTELTASKERDHAHR